MAISFNTVLLLSILIINVIQLDSFKLHTRNEHNSPCCQQSLFSLFSYSPCACPPPPPPPQHYSTPLPPKEKLIKHETIKGEYTTPKYHHVSSSLPPKSYHVNKCGPPQCYVNPANQAVELEKIFKDASSRIVDYTSTATGPVIYVAESISHGADLIPMLFAASGDLLGKAIAGPIKFFNKLGFGFLTGAISQVISIPITFGTSVRASIINVQPYLGRIMSIGNGCCSQATQSPPLIGSGIEQIALKPIGILAGASHLALGTMLNIGGSTFKLIGTLTKSGGEFAEVAGYDLKTTGALKVANGVSSIASFVQKLGTPSSVICVVEDDKINFYQHVEEKKKEKIEKVVKVENVEKVEKVGKVGKVGKDKPNKSTVPAESYKSTTQLYLPPTTKATVNYIPVTTPYANSSTAKYIDLSTTTPYSTTTTTFKSTTEYLPPKASSPELPAFYPNSEYDSGNMPDVPDGYPEGSPISDTAEDY